MRGEVGSSSPMRGSDLLMSLNDLESTGGYVLPLPAQPEPLSMLGECMSGGFRRGELTILAGPPGNGKSYLSLLIAATAQRLGARWAYQPIEDDATRWLHRYCAVHYRDWRWLNRDTASIAYMRQVQASDRETLNAVGTCIMENPRRPYYDDNGDFHAPDLGFDRVLEWVSKEAQRAGLIIIDPVSMIDFDGQGLLEFQGQRQLIRNCAGIANLTGSHILLVAHTEKRPGSRGTLGLADVQGAADFTRFAQNVIMLDYHEERESETEDATGTIAKVQHKRTLVVAKCREGQGQGECIAMDFDRSGGAAFQERGIIV